MTATTAFKKTLAALAVGLALSTPAAATEGYVLTDVNLRAGPGTGYPALDVIPAGEQVTIHGCLSDRAWCDVTSSVDRGWMSSRYLQTLYSGRRFGVREIGPRVALPVISFQIGRYWDDHYRDRSWYRERDRWERRRDDGWRERERRVRVDRIYRDDRDDEWGRPRDDVRRVIIEHRYPDGDRDRGEGGKRKGKWKGGHCPPGQAKKGNC